MMAMQGAWRRPYRLYECVRHRGLALLDVGEQGFVDCRVDRRRLVFREQFLVARVAALRMGEAAFGPDLATVQHWPRQALLDKILNPNRSVADGYEFWTVARKSGGGLSGVITDETPTSITLRNQIETITIPRTDIETITASTVSAMPTGLEVQIDEQQMTDLLAFLKHLP